MLLDHKSIQLIISYLRFFRNHGKFPDLKNPKDLNEKLMYLNYNDYYNNDTITRCVDKYRVKEYVGSKDCNVLSAELYGHYDTVEELVSAWEGLPKTFMLKCNHGCGYNIAVRDKDKEDLSQIAKRLEKWMHTDYWKRYCEVQYKNVKKCIIAEQFLGEDLKTYKFYCFNGRPEFLYVSVKGEDDEYDKYIDYFDMDGNRLPVKLYPHPNYDGEIKLPDTFEKMRSISEILSKDFPFVRVDLYDMDGIIYFSEFTFIPTGGMMIFEPRNTIEKWGNLLVIADILGSEK